MFILEGHTARISDSALAFSPDGRLLASGGADHVVRLWDLVTRRQRAVLARHTQQITGVGFVDEGRVVVSSSWDGDVRFQDAHSEGVGREVRPAWLTGQTLNCLGLDRARRTLAVAGGVWLGGGNRVLLWDLQRHQPLKEIGKHEQPIGGVAFDPDGRWLFSGGADCRGKLWNLVTGRPGPVMKFRGWLQGQAWCDARTVAIAAGTTIHLFDTVTGKVRQRFRGHTRRLTSLAISPDGKILLSAARDGTVRLWNLEEAQLPPPDAGQAGEGPVRAVYSWQIGAPHAVAVSPDGMTAAVGGASGRIIIWDLEE
jgi:WD40 repeat protein